MTEQDTRLFCVLCNRKIAHRKRPKHKRRHIRQAAVRNKQQVDLRTIASGRP